MFMYISNKCMVDFCISTIDVYNVYKDRGIEGEGIKWRRIKDKTGGGNEGGQLMMD